MTSLHTLIQTLDNWMEADSFKDYAPNGLQVEGLGSVYKLALGVTASADVIEQAAVWGADALLVHHGYFWKNESPTLIGMKGHRVRALFENQISLIAYHLPLDCHPEFGNNKTLLDQLDLSGGTAIEGERGLLWSVPLNGQFTLPQLAAEVASRLNRTPLVIESPRAPKSLNRLIVCTGGAQDYLSKAKLYGGDVYLSGEISERTTHEARELGVHYISAGHHATERYGVQALGAKVRQEFGIEVAFFDDHNPA
ncbi:MAG: Nif3-like dinuclear metal center hexameric protein [Litorivicinaceae bacterium]|nr:Nif3-like dinuclear metal center hexameric protein [Gammaproteobacteria bacterium]RPG20092.1 MAG: Nif3-like dinuclear metal center hexameric protein [Oceanospirillales bacterium TMED33]RZO76692.1 MAG: Nif3-like dinuclear metal center hexameric protein [Litorivicinaceae bacterium]CAI8303559.1 MAG: GTP cyclohydrolase 1 type 2 [Gammaproteobacteria bacterium]